MSNGSNGVNANQLMAFIERIETVETEIRERGEDKKEIYSELKGNGFDPKIVRKIVAVSRKAEDARREESELMSLYLDALGMQGVLPL